MKTKQQKSTKAKVAGTVEVGSVKAEKSKDKLAKKIAKLHEKATGFAKKSEKWEMREHAALSKIAELEARLQALEEKQ